MNNLEGHSRSSEFPIFDRPYITSYDWSVVTTIPSPRYCYRMYLAVLLVLQRLSDTNVFNSKSLFDL